MIAIRASQDGGGSSHEILPARLGQNTRKLMVMIGKCFKRFPISSLGEPNVYQNLVCFTRMWDFTWMVSDCGELVGIIHRR